MASVNRELIDMRHLVWSKTRHSSGTAGSFLKSQDIIDKKKIYYKLSNYDAINGIVGHECINEIVVDRLLDELGISHVKYSLIHGIVLVDEKEFETYFCASEDFKQPGDSKIPFDVFFDIEREKDESPIEFCNRMNWQEYIDVMLLVDFLILNRDRHGANIEVLRNNLNRTHCLAPLFDHGLSLLFNCKNDEEVLNANVLEDKAVQCFVGNHSSYNNLKLISENGLRKLPPFDKKMKTRLFEGLSGIVTETWIDKVWEMLRGRAEQYEDFRNNR